MLGHWGGSNVCHVFSGACFYVQVRHKEQVGDYCLGMQMSTDAAIIFGREVFGEPKKYAKSTLERTGSMLQGRVERYDGPIIRIEATMKEKEPPTEGASSTSISSSYRSATDRASKGTRCWSWRASRPNRPSSSAA
jgi:acetoacetate decarboxylase